MIIGHRRLSQKSYQESYQNRMPRVLISDDFVRRAVLPAGRDDYPYRDRKLTGFQLRLRRTGDGISKTFQIEFGGGPRGSRRSKMVIGDAATFSAAEARAEATAMLKAVAMGDDPKAIRQAKKDAPTWEDLVAAFEVEHIAFKAPGTAKDYHGRIRRSLTPAFKGLRAAAITSDMVAALKRKKRANPTDFNRALAVLSVMMNLACAKGWRPDNPVAGIKRYPEQPRDAWLDEVGLPRFLAVLQARPVDPLHDLIRFDLVTGWRISEARLLDWSEVDLARRQATIPTKTGRQVRQLSADAATLIDRQPRHAGPVFSGKAMRPLDYGRLCAALTAICAEAGIARITLHVLRHTAATWAAVGGADLLELRQAFGWAGLAMPNRYVSRAEALGRQGVERAAIMLNVLGKPDGEVRQLPPSRRR